MSTIRVIDCRSWIEFKSDVLPALFGSSPFAPGKWLFRGQRDAAWELETSYDRWFRNWAAKGDRIQLAVELLRGFLVQVERAGVDWPEPIDSVETAALAQHHGVPTRLLDWTDSPYVAAFFAFHGGLTPIRAAGGMVAVWALRRDAGIWSSELGVEVVRPRSRGNERLRKQFGEFTRSRTPFATLNEYVRNSADVDPPALVKFVIPLSEAAQALADVSAMGIGARRLFRDLDGAAAEAVQQIVLSRVW